MYEFLPSAPSVPVCRPIFDTSSLTHLDLSCNHLGDEGVCYLSYAIMSGCLNDLQHINLDFNHITDASAQTLFQALRGLPNLTYLSLRGNQLNITAGYGIVGWLRNLVVEGISENVAEDPSQGKGKNKSRQPPVPTTVRGAPLKSTNPSNNSSGNNSRNSTPSGTGTRPIGVSYLQAQANQNKPPTKPIAVGKGATEPTLEEKLSDELGCLTVEGVLEFMKYTITQHTALKTKPTPPAITSPVPVATSMRKTATAPVAVVEPKVVPFPPVVLTHLDIAQNDIPAHVLVTIAEACKEVGSITTLYTSDNVSSLDHGPYFFTQSPQKHAENPLVALEANTIVNVQAHIQCNRPATESVPALMHAFFSGFHPRLGYESEIRMLTPAPPLASRVSNAKPEMDSTDSPSTNFVPFQSDLPQPRNTHHSRVPDVHSNLKLSEQDLEKLMKELCLYLP